MLLFDNKQRQQYVKNGDSIKSMMSLETSLDNKWASHRWLAESREKRLIYWHMCGDFIINYDSGGLLQTTESIFSNGRHIYMVRFKGAL